MLDNFGVLHVTHECVELDENGEVVWLIPGLSVPMPKDCEADLFPPWPTDEDPFSDVSLMQTFLIWPDELPETSQ